MNVFGTYSCALLKIPTLDKDQLSNYRPISGVGKKRECGRGPFKNPKDGEIHLTFKQISQQNIYFSRKRYIWWAKVAIVEWLLASFVIFRRLLLSSLAVFRGFQLACVSPFYHVRKIRIVVRLDTKTLRIQIQVIAIQKFRQTCKRRSQIQLPCLSNACPTNTLH